MITNVIFSNSVNKQVTAELVPDLSNTTPRYFIGGIQGLGPVGSELASSNTPGADGVRIHRPRLGPRNLVFSIRHSQYSVGDSVEALRDDLYSTMVPGSKLTIQFLRTNKPTLTAEGYVETIEPDIFTDTPTLAMSILCESSYFLDGALRTQTVSNQTQLNTLNNELGSAPTEFSIRFSNVPAGTTYVELGNGTGSVLRADNFDITPSDPALFLIFRTFAGDRYFSATSGAIYDKVTGDYGLSISKSRPLSIASNASVFLPFEIEYYKYEVGV